jgi:segregation and condensation protein B
MEEIDSLLAGYRERARGAKPINPLSPMIEEIALEMGIPTGENGISAAPDYAGIEAEIQVPTHQPYEMEILERIMERYEAILNGLTEDEDSR